MQRAQTGPRDFGSTPRRAGPIRCLAEQVPGPDAIGPLLDLARYPRAFSAVAQEQRGGSGRPVVVVGGALAHFELVELSSVGVTNCGAFAQAIGQGDPRSALLDLPGPRNERVSFERGPLSYRFQLVARGYARRPGSYWLFVPSPSTIERRSSAKCLTDCNPGEMGETGE